MKSIQVLPLPNAQLKPAIPVGPAGHRTSGELTGLDTASVPGDASSLRSTSSSFLPVQLAFALFRTGERLLHVSGGGKMKQITEKL